MNSDFLFRELEKFSKNALKKNKGVSLVPTISVGSKMSNIKQYHKVQSKYETILRNNLIKFMDGNLSESEFISKQKEAMKSAYSDAYLLGKKLTLGNKASLDSSENSFIGKAVADEMEFMKNFALDVKNNSGTMSYLNRIKMYSDSLSAVYGFGKLIYMPEDVKIIWRLGNTDKHCVDCLSIAAKNPYTKKTLPAFPKSGSTQCLSNCLCSLDYQISNSKSDYDHFITTLKPNKSYPNIPDEDQYGHLMNLKNLYYDQMYKFEYSGKDEDKKAALQIKYQILNYIDDYKLAFPDIDKDVKKAMLDFRSFRDHKNFKLTEDISPIMTGNIVSIFAGDKQLYGKVGKKYPTQFEAKLLDGTSVLVNPKSSKVFLYG